MLWVYCLDCQQIVDYWKYDDWKRDHGDHTYRELTPEEREIIINECIESGCFEIDVSGGERKQK